MAERDESQRTNGGYYDVEAFNRAFALGAAVRQQLLQDPEVQVVTQKILDTGIASDQK